MSRVTRQGFLNAIQHAFSNKPGKLDIKRREPGILFTSLQYGFTLQKAFITLFIFVLVQRHDDLIKAHAVR